jgi:flagellar assembly protein FliH
MDDKALLRGIRAALELLAQESRIEIKVHPEDLQIARRFAQRWVEKVAREAVIRVLPSDSVGRGGCMIEGEEGNVDARVESQLAALHQALRLALTGPTPADAGEKG